MKFLVSGLINIETTLAVSQFPVEYEPVRFPFHGVNSTVSGVGCNIAKALTVLGNQVNFLSLIGRDAAASLVRTILRGIDIQDDYILSPIEKTAQSVILYEPSGRRAIFVDLKDIQEQAYPAQIFDEAAQKCDLCALCNINFNRSLLRRAKDAGKLIATDVHTLADLNDAYNADFMQAADILFLSDEKLPVPPEEFARQALVKYPARILVIGLGASGALLALRGERAFTCYPAVPTRPLINTIGAGDALFSSFLHTFAHTRDAHLALRKAIVFASYKIGANGAAEGFLDAPSLDGLFAQADKSFHLSPG